MCGRYELSATPLELANHFADLVSNADVLGSLPASYNIAPSTVRPVIRFAKSEGANVVDMLVWGFRPAWAKRSYINARAETLFTSGAFKESATKRRCLVIATGWYEWQATGAKQKQPYFIHADRPFAFAGIWTARKIGEAWEKSYAIVTAPASAMLERIHDRMPLVLHPRHYAAWINGSTPSPQALMQPFDGGGLEAYPVSTLVNDPKNDAPALIERAD